MSKEQRNLIIEDLRHHLPITDDVLHLIDLLDQYEWLIDIRDADETEATTW